VVVAAVLIIVGSVLQPPSTAGRYPSIVNALTETEAPSAAYIHTTYSLVAFFDACRAPIYLVSFTVSLTHCFIFLSNEIKYNDAFVENTQGCFLT
jgi:hypothetical protein